MKKEKEIPSENITIIDVYDNIEFNPEFKTGFGFYTHKTKGILDKFRKPANACIIFNINKMKDVKKLCEKYSINSKFYKIEEFF